MSATTVNIIISGVSVSGDIATHKTRVVIDLGNSDRIGKIEFALQNKDGTYKAKLVSGNATVQADVIQNGVTTTVFRGTLERLDDEIDVKQGTQAHFTGYDYGQELLGLISPDARQKSTVSGGILSLTSGEQGMGSTQGMDLVIFVSGVVASGAAGYGLGSNSGQPATTLSAFMSQFYGKSGDTTGSNSGQAFSFKPYLSGMTTSGVFPGSTYKTWYAQDGASDTNANYVVLFDTMRAKHEYAWDVLRKLTRQGHILDRSGFKTQFEVYIGISGDINLITSGTSNFISSGVLVYYQAGQSGAANNNIIDARVPFDTTNLKNEIVAWFPIWSQYPFTDDWSDLVAYSGSYWSGGNTTSGGTVTLSGNAAAPGAPGFISIMGFLTSGGNGGGTTGGFEMIFTLWSGYTLNIQRWNVSGGAGVGINYQTQGSVDASNGGSFTHNTRIIDTSGNYIIVSGGTTSSIASYGTTGPQLIANSGWAAVSLPIYTTSGTFFSGDGTTGWAFGALVAGASGIPDLTRVKQIGLGFGRNGVGSVANNWTYMVDNLNFGFAFNYNPVIALDSGSISAYGRRYEVFEFPFQTTDSGAASVVTSELQSKQSRRMLAEFTVKDNPNIYPAQLNITPGQIFIVDAPSLNTGSGQTFFYWRAIEVKHEWSHNQGFLTHIKGYAWSSGGITASGQNLISYSLPIPAPTPRVESQMPITHWWGVSKAG